MWIAKEREKIFSELNLVLLKVLERLGIEQFENLTFKINHGWDQTLSLLDSLISTCDKDIHLGYTSVGVHRADFHLHANNRSIRDIYSRGEMKLLSFALHLSQLIYLGRSLKSKSILLIDDLFAEIDKTNIDKLMTTLRHFNSQTFITTTDEALLNKYYLDGDKVFHVEHGKLKVVL
jgi:DNA replication and repair protein RecF